MESRNITQKWLDELDSTEFSMSSENGITKFEYFEEKYLVLKREFDENSEFLSKKDYKVEVLINEEEYWFAILSKFLVPKEMDKIEISDWEDAFVEMNELAPIGHFLVYEKEGRVNVKKRIEVVYRTHQRFISNKETEDIENTIKWLRDDHEKYFFRLVQELVKNRVQIASQFIIDLFRDLLKKKPD